MLGEVMGSLGSGKTLFLSSLINEVSPKTKIYANYHIKCKNFTLVGVEDLENLKEGLLLIDEAYLWLESRTSGSELNRYISYLIFQSRKRGFDVFASTQINTALDLRFRLITDVKILAIGLDKNKIGFKYMFQGWGNTKNILFPYEKAKEIFKIYDTLEYPELEVTTYEPKRLNKVINEIIKSIKKDYPNLIFTKGIIEDILLEKEMFSTNLAEKVYNRLKKEQMLEKVKDFKGAGP